ncbi:hypothetical protein NP233_g9007 [Leucocoprinus birnbaumii]|uniref:Transposase domain-containing protein n=1 Tax=Leucocoprinus birnbaumii TaxID=56174 RepID=A0AAD5YNJ9_9AGAR|nr:hypothetical protein NP233_g9007 [Leucocoprinus birnbaumii]
MLKHLRQSTDSLCQKYLLELLHAKPSLRRLQSVKARASTRRNKRLPHSTPVFIIPVESQPLPQVEANKREQWEEVEDEDEYEEILDSNILDVDIDHVNDLLDRYLEEEELQDDEDAIESDNAHTLLTNPPAPLLSRVPVNSNHPTDEGDEEMTAEELEKLEEELASRILERPLLDNGHGLKPVRVLRYSEKHHNSRVGSVIDQKDTSDQAYATSLHADANSESFNPWAPFNSQVDWEVAQWAKGSGITTTALTSLLSIKEVPEKLGLSYKNIRELNHIIDTKLPQRPKFHRREVLVNGENIVFYARDMLECIQHLWRAPDLSDDLLVEPERHYCDEKAKKQIFHEMNTGHWWWKKQTEIEKATGNRQATIVPVILSSDKTLLTSFRNKTAYPLYLTLGNIPKHARRKPSRQCQVLLAYLPTSKLEHIHNKASRRRAVANLFHACVHNVIKPLEDLGRSGTVLVSGNGAARHGYPILAAFVGDYLEQILVTLVRYGKCPVCPAHRNEIGDEGSAQDPRDIEPIRAALSTVDKGPKAFGKACSEAGIKAVQGPFWNHLPFSNIYASITPDILHQLYQGVIRHLLTWLTAVLGAEEINRRCAALPPNHHIRIFEKGITGLSRVTGAEHDQMCRFLIGLVLDVRLPSRESSTKLIKCVRALLDFLYLAKYPVHSTDTLNAMSSALADFRQNRDVFIELKIRKHYHIPKLHFLDHYFFFLCQFGTLDNFNTEYTERLHINMAKDAFRATNMKDEYPQMTVWLDRYDFTPVTQTCSDLNYSGGVRCSQVDPRFAGLHSSASKPFSPLISDYFSLASNSHPFSTACTVSSNQVCQ